MPPRNRRCRNCPQPTTTTAVVLSSEDEAAKVWNQIVTATALCIGMMEGYQQLGLLGTNSEAITALAGRLMALAHGEFEE